jgi:hypothetical protein
MEQRKRKILKHIPSHRAILYHMSLGAFGEKALKTASSDRLERRPETIKEKRGRRRSFLFASTVSAA